MSRWHTTEFDMLPLAAFKPRGGKFGPMTLEGGGKGGGGSSAPPPDPRLIEAQIKSLGVQDKAVEQIMANVNRMLPIQEQQMQFGLDTAKKSFDQAQDDRQFALGRRGLLATNQDRAIKDAADFNTDARRDQIAQQALADVNQSFGQVQQQQTRNLARMGVNPNSGKFAALNNQLTTQQAAASAGAANKSREAARQEGYALTDRANNVLAGFPAMASSNTGQGFGFGTAGVGLTNQSLAGMNSGLAQGAGIAGQQGSNAASMYGAMGSYKNGQDQIAASESNSLMSLAGAAGKAYAFSDKRLKTKVGGIKPKAALEAVNKTPVKSWQYKKGSAPDDGGKRHVGPMAQDVQKNMGNQAGPEGTKIDLVTMNGINMAAIQALSEKVKRLEGKKGLKNG